MTFYTYLANGTGEIVFFLLRGKVGQEREAIGRDFAARQQAGVHAAMGSGNPGTPTSVMNPFGGTSPPVRAAAAEMQDLASLRRGAFDLTQPKIRAENDLEISSEPQVLTLTLTLALILALTLALTLALALALTLALALALALVVSITLIRCSGASSCRRPTAAAALASTRRRQSWSI